MLSKKYIDRLWRGVSKENMRHQRAWLSSLRALAMEGAQLFVCQLDAEPPQSLSICKPGNFGLQAFFHKKQKQHRAPNPLNPQLLAMTFQSFLCFFKQKHMGTSSLDCFKLFGGPFWLSESSAKPAHKATYFIKHRKTLTGKKIATKPYLDQQNAQENSRFQKRPKKQPSLKKTAVTFEKPRQPKTNTVVCW